MPAAHRRASDTERVRVVGLLRDASAQGRLTVEELDERTASAYAALTRGELAELFDDLPLPRSEPARQPVRRRRSLPRVPGRLVLVLVLVLVRRYQPGWTILLAIFLFPVGLLALLARSSETVTIDLVARDGYTLTMVQGIAPLKIRHALAELED